MICVLGLVVVHHKDFPIRILRVAIRTSSVVSHLLLLLRLSVVIWCFEQLDVIHVPRIL